MDEALLSTVLELARLGAVGIGAIVLLLSFFLLFRSSSIDAEKAKLIHRFMTLGFVFGIAAGVLGLVPLFIARGGPLSERLAFSPDFESEKLQPPTIRLPDGTEAKHNAKFDLQPSGGTQVVTIAMDATLDQVRNLKETSANLTSAVAKATKQRDALAVKAAAKQAPEGKPNTEALQYLQQNSVTLGAYQAAFARSIKAGDYAKANQLTYRLQSYVNDAAPAVAVIATPKQETPPH